VTASVRLCSLSENTEHSLRHWKFSQNATLHRCFQGVNF